MRHLIPLALVWCGLATIAAPARGDEFAAALDQLQKIAPYGSDNTTAAKAWKVVAAGDASKLLVILPCFDDASPLGENYLRSACETIADRALAGGGKLPIAALEKYLADTSHEPRARRMVYEWIAKSDPQAGERLIPTMLQDPSIELRRDAVARLVAQGDEAKKKDDKTAAIKLYQQALAGARDPDQVEDLSKKLADLGQPVDLPRHFGFLMEWKLIGPFDNKDKKGFPVAYPPEEKIDPTATLVGKDGAECRWVDHVTADPNGIVELNKALGKFKGALCYATTDFNSDREQTVEIRLGCVTAWKLWVNGELIFDREEYHRGFTLDQYRMTAKFQKGKNVILLKVCQNEQTEDWAQRWQFQLRVCDPAGTAILAVDRPATQPAPKTEEKP